MRAIWMENKNKLDFYVQKSKPTFVKPETTQHITNKLYFLSNLDQVLTHQTEMVYCYRVKDGYESSANAANAIKDALSKVLVHFYPLAGRLVMGSNGKLIVECTDEGVPFVEAYADCEMDVVDVQVPNALMSSRLVYANHDAHSLLDLPLLTVQVTRFKCGGFTLGINIGHCMADGMTVVLFISSWAEIARGVPLSVTPFTDRSIIKPRIPCQIGDYPFNKFTESINDICYLPSHEEDAIEEEVVIKSFKFDAEKISELKKIAMEDKDVKSCTSFTALAALVWRARAQALNMDLDEQAKLLIMVDGRSRIKPLLPQGYFGNGVVITGCDCTVRELIEQPLSFAVKLVQRAVQSVDDGFVNSWIDYFEEHKAKPALAGSFLITSWTRFDFKADFGWGDPVDWGCVEVPPEVSLFLADDGKGIEKPGVKVMLGMPVRVMKTFQDLLQV